MVNAAETEQDTASLASILPTEALQKLMEIGFIGAKQGFIPQARAIFDGLAAIRPTSEYPILGQAFTHLSAGDPHLAIKTLSEQALALNPNSEFAQFHLGFTLWAASYSKQADTILSALLEHGTEASALTGAQAILSDIRKSPLIS